MDRCRCSKPSNEGSIPSGGALVDLAQWQRHYVEDVASKGSSPLVDTMARSHSGLVRLVANQVVRKGPWVRIPLSPPCPSRQQADHTGSDPVMLWVQIPPRVRGLQGPVLRPIQGKPRESRSGCVKPDHPCLLSTAAVQRTLNPWVLGSNPRGGTNAMWRSGSASPS